MRTICFAIFLFGASTLYAQNSGWYGKIVDAQTGTSIGEVNLSVPEKGIYFPADKDGAFIVVDKVSKADSINFSCIGYQAKKIKAGDITPDAVIKLTPLVKMLREVKIGIVQLGSRAKQEEMWTAYHPLDEEAMYMPNEKNLQGAIQSVGFFLSNGLDGDVTAPFRVRIYEASPNDMPANELVKDVIVVVAHKSNAWFDVDLSGYSIKVPKNGFFVSFCLFDGARYSTSANIGIGPNAVTPRLGMTQSEFSQRLSFHWQRGHGAWFWENEPFTYNYMIRATVVPE